MRRFWETAAPFVCTVLVIALIAVVGVFAWWADTRCEQRGGRVELVGKVTVCERR